MDFESLASALLSQSRILLPGWLPGGRPRGNEYVCSSIRGGKGESLSVNMDTGAWADFATQNVRGGDLISLYAAINNLRQSEAYERLKDSFMPSLPALPKKQKSEKIEVGIVPQDASVPEMRHPDLGLPAASWKYKNQKGELLFYIARYDNPICIKCGKTGIDKMCPACGTKQEKQMLPWSWVSKFNAFKSMGWPAPRPLYGLDKLTDLPVMIVEGEKSCENARRLVGDSYCVITWPNGTNAVKKADWAPIYGKAAVIWPDADEPGVTAAFEIAQILHQHTKDIKIIGVQGQPKGWDAADAVSEGWDSDRFFEWAKPRVERYEAVAELLPDEKPVPVVADQEENLPQSVYSMWEQIGLARNSNGQPICNMDNVLRVFEASEDFKDIVWYDEFERKYFTKWKTGTRREWGDVDELNMVHFFQRELGMSRVSAENVNSAVVVYGHKHKRNELVEWLESLKWDGNPRVEKFFIDCLGAADNEHHRAASKNWWTSMVARAMRPGTKVDSMIILEGPQGKFKSTALGLIGGKWYCETHESVTNKDFFMVLQGRLIVEISELDSFSNAEINTIKKVITCQVDRYRPPYGRASADFPRMCVFCGTTNESNYLRDPTGARRFWPIKTGAINLPKIKEDREQLFAEAVHLMNAGHAWWIMPKSTMDVQESRRETDEWETAIVKYIQEHKCGPIGYSLADIAREALWVPIEKLDRRIQLRVSKILRFLGYESRTIRRGDAQIVCRAWFPSEEFSVPQSSPTQ